jgi:hypothetical protein
VILFALRVKGGVYAQASLRVALVVPVCFRLPRCGLSPRRRPASSKERSRMPPALPSRRDRCGPEYRDQLRADPATDRQTRSSASPLPLGPYRVTVRSRVHNAGSRRAHPGGRPDDHAGAQAPRDLRRPAGGEGHPRRSWIAETTRTVEGRPGSTRRRFKPPNNGHNFRFHRSPRD